VQHRKHTEVKYCILATVTYKTQMRKYTDTMAFNAKIVMTKQH